MVGWGLKSRRFERTTTRWCWKEGVSHFLSEMSCGEVVAGSLLVPGRAFEFSFLRLFPLSPPLFLCCTTAVLPLDGDPIQ